jgi:hypothetical protein
VTSREKEQLAIGAVVLWLLLRSRPAAQKELLGAWRLVYRYQRGSLGDTDYDGYTSHSADDDHTSVWVFSGDPPPPPTPGVHWFAWNSYDEAGPSIASQGMRSSASFTTWADFWASGGYPAVAERIVWAHMTPEEEAKLPRPTQAVP